MRWFIAQFCVCLFLSSVFVHADVVLDLDGTTSAIESSLNVTVGSTLNIHAVETGSLSVLRDRVGIDVYYVQSSDTATTTPLVKANDGGGLPTHTLAGPLAGLSSSGLSEDIFLPGVFIGPGNGLREGSLLPSFGYLNSIGGLGYTAVPSVDDYPNSFPIRIANWDFQFPTVGVVHLGVCGILDGSPVANGTPTLVPGNVYHEIDVNRPFPTVCGPGVVVNVTAVPEPSSFALLAVVSTFAFFVKTTAILNFMNVLPGRLR